MSDFVILNNETEWNEWASRNYPNRTLYVVPTEYPVGISYTLRDDVFYHLYYQNELNEVSLASECGCELHQEHRRIQNILNKYNAPDEVRELVERLQDQIMDLDESNQYYESLFDGTWPEGREILREAIRKYPAEISSIPGPDFCIDKNKDL